MQAWVGYAWRLAALMGGTMGLALSALVGDGAPGAEPALLAALAIALAVIRPRSGRSSVTIWLGLVAGIASLVGLTVGVARLDAVDAGRYTAGEGEWLEVRGTVVSTPKVSGGATRFVLETERGRIGVESRGIVGAVDEGSVVAAAGTVRLPAPWEAGSLERSGAVRVLVAESVGTTGAARGGLRGALDDVRRRAEAALARGTPEASAALLRGFVLGQDDRIAEDVREDFRRSGLSHVLAVSGQNVMFLALLALPLFALAGVPIRARLLAIVAVIAIYVPVAGAGASIQRAGVMGAAGLIAALAGRPRARWYALGLAALVTLALDPRATGDIGWQLSFVAVAGLALLTGPLVRATGSPSSLTSPARRALAEGCAMTVAASLATGPFVAHHFGTVSLTAIPANLVALPAIAPAMWLGMLSGALGQIPGAPVEPLTWLGGLCAGFIGWVAHAFGPEWAQLEIPEPGLPAALAWSCVLVGGARVSCLWLERRDALRPGWRQPLGRRAAIASLVALACAAAAGVAARGFDTQPPAPTPRLVISVLDVGQGDAILLEPRGQPGLLVDTGAPEAALGEALAARGVEELAAVAVTHDQRDHAGGLEDVLGEVEVGRLLVGSGTPSACQVVTCPPVRELSAGAKMRIGGLRIEVLWPPPGAPEAEDANAGSLVLLASVGEFDALLTGDAESELASFRPRPVEVLKVAHHGSEDAGLDSLLTATSPDVAVISVGAGNSYGHPAPETLSSLSEKGIGVARTDDAGEVVIEVGRDGWSVG